jgi:hypothetical protein
MRWRRELKHAPQIKDKVRDTKKTKETDAVLLAPANSRNEAHVPHTTEFTSFIPIQSSTHSHMLRGTPEIIWILRSNVKLAHYSHRKKPHGQTLQSKQSQHADHPEWSHKAEHCNGTIRMLFLHNWKSPCRDPKSEWYTEWNHKAKHCRGTNICMQCKKNETTQMNTHSHIKCKPG